MRARRQFFTSGEEHCLTFANVGLVAAIPEMSELNIGHFLIGQAIFDGLDAAVRQMKSPIAAARVGSCEHSRSSEQG